MKRQSWSGFIALVAFAITLVASAMLVWSVPCEAAAKKEKTRIFTGKVVSLDMASRSLIISGKTGDKSFTSERKLLKGVKIGDKVKVTYIEKSGQGVIKKIDHVRAKSDKKVAPKRPGAP